jgi:predicted MPP superfamily phosphohydrolase
MSIFFGVLFLSVVIAIVFESHWIVFVSVLPLLNADSIWQKKALFIGLIVCGVSFFLASAAAHWWENGLTRAWYFSSAVWLGTLANLVIAFVAVWLLIWIGGWLGWALPMKACFGTALVAALLVSVYGVWAAMTPAVTRVTVHIPNLPDSWKGKTIVQLTDVHIGHIYRAKFLEGVVQQVNALDPKMVVITGDLFDGMDGVLEDSVLPLNHLRSERGTFYVTGNHETYLGVERSLAALQHTPVKILYDEVVDVDGLKVIGIDYPKRDEQKSVPAVLQSLVPQFTGQPNILLFHAPNIVSQARAAGVNLFLAGHTHRGQQWPFRYITWLVYHGYDYGLHTEGDFTLFTSSGLGSWGPPMRIGTRSEIVAITLE